MNEHRTRIRHREVKFGPVSTRKRTGSGTRKHEAGAETRWQKFESWLSLARTKTIF